ncbi:MAG: hypothetical protein CMJ58_25100 [Planctomycetaceae bacterium]|nr:hypothetical protein [Planctomycetaceae bacterium]
MCRNESARATLPQTLPAREGGHAAVAPVLVVGCGNKLAGDDAFGPAVIAELQRRRLPGVECVDLGMRPFALCERLPGRAALVVVDAAETTGGIAAGELVDVDFFAADVRLLHDVALSTHGLSLPDELEMARTLGWLPAEVRLVAATVNDATVGKPMTAATCELVQAAVECIVRRTSAINLG